MTEIPTWAAKFLEKHLPPGNPVVNARRLGANKVLANTQLGAVLVRRNLFTGTRIEFLEVPSEKLAFQCASCKENLQFLNLQLPRTVYCSICATKYDVDGHGEVTTGGQTVEAQREPIHATGEGDIEAHGACCEQTGCCAGGCDASSCCSDETCECCVDAQVVAREHPHGETDDDEPEALEVDEVDHDDRTADEADLEDPTTAEPIVSTAGAFTHAGYTLYRRDVATKSGSRPLYFFSKGEPKSGTAIALPEGYEVGVNERTGLPFLRRAAEAVEEAPRAKKAPGANPGTGYKGDTHPVLHIEGIGEGHRARLEAAGVTTTDQLYRAPTRPLAKAIDVPARTVAEWQVMAELMMVKGIGPQYAEAMALAGVAGVDELKKRSGAAIAKQVNAFLDRQEVRLIGQPLSPARVEAWKNAAKAMRKSGIVPHVLA